MKRYLSFDRLAMIIVLAYGAITRTVSSPRDFGLTPVTTTMSRGQLRQYSIVKSQSIMHTSLADNILLEGIRSLFCSGVCCKLDHTLIRE